MAASYKGGGHWAVNKWENFVHFAKYPYPSATHGNRFVVNYTNKIGAEAYAQYGAVNPVPPGTTSAKASFVVDAKGQASIGPMFIMEKMTSGFNAATADWRYAMVMPGGTTTGITGGPGSDAMTFCHDCHTGAEDADYLFFLPEEVRAR
ncbi:MAG: cytochrome P460 family protein [Hyphomicrobiales bacterium]|nr:cytochrome P460 family protein [Hyphomicrobiales bacterium]MCP4998249.1 cytochrome P460 family protein [Hyphomicrobiales bacterium]